jgi:uncharacterized protein (DUF2236 family)
VRTEAYFTDDSMLRRVHRERALALAGPRALLMQAAHPLAVTGLLAHSSALEEPYERLARTAETLSVIGFGSRADADRVTRHVRAMHRRVSGRLPAAVGRYTGYAFKRCMRASRSSDNASSRYSTAPSWPMCRA